MHIRGRLAAATVVFAGVTVVTLALAAPRHGKAPKPRPKPAATADAGGGDDPYDDKAGAAAGDAGAPTAASDGGAGPVPPPPGLVGADGGVKPSPLTPAPGEFAQPGVVDAGAVDFDKLIGDIAALRARAAAVGDTLFRSRLTIALRTDGDHARIAHLVVSLDDGAVYSAPPTFHAEDMTQIYAHALSAGRHAITVDIERRDDRNDAFRTTQRSRFIVEVPQDQALAVELRVGDDSDMGGDFPSDKSGSYDLRVRLKAEAHKVKR